MVGFPYSAPVLLGHWEPQGVGRGEEGHGVEAYHTHCTLRIT